MMADVSVAVYGDKIESLSAGSVQKDVLVKLWSEL